MAGDRRRIPLLKRLNQLLGQLVDGQCVGFRFGVLKRFLLRRRVAAAQDGDCHHGEQHGKVPLHGSPPRKQFVAVTWEAREYVS